MIRRAHASLRRAPTGNGVARQLQVVAAALVNVSAPVLVVKLLAALAVMLTAPPVTLPMVVVPLPVVFTFVVPVRLVVPLVTVRFLPVATVVSPLRVTAPYRY